MKRLVLATLCVGIMPVLFGCKSGPPPAPPPPVYQKEAIRLNFKADPRLNLYQNSSHALLVCVYQLADPNGFNQLLDERDGFPRLLECGRFDGSVASAKKLVVQPGEEFKEAIDRAEGAKYLSVVAGYYNPQKEKPSRLYSIPPVLGGKKGKPMNVVLYLGPQAIEDLGVK